METLDIRIIGQPLTLCERNRRSRDTSMVPQSTVLLRYRFHLNLPNAPKTLKSPQHSREERKSMRKSLSRLSLSVIKSHHHNQNPFQISSHFNGNPPKIPSTISHELNPFLLHTKNPILSLQFQAFLHIFCRFGKYPGGGS